MTVRILAFNTVTELCSVAIMVGEKIYDYSILAPQSHDKKILFIINQLLIDSGVSLKSLDCIVFDQGPGNFIGVRIGISVAQGLAVGADLPLVAVSSLAVLAHKAWRIFCIKNIIAMIDARMNKLFWARYLYNDFNNIWIRKDDDGFITLSVAQNIISNTLSGEWMIVGTGWNNHQQLQCCIDKSDKIILKKVMLPEAHDMLLLGINSWNINNILTPDQIRPIY
ncbi:glycoprotease [Candidatus Blochmanniella vafra str. BVAF]|uniref:tRNA threonylcarbamoyladenosine biosynthesis protein TsaB n=1 Tax=Blochmanniella vafra (strain BVAF) TaxID=859654 RepID=E8Q708_BLOVB|nr:tRNA (adenosine(37)-N6)-threonylcarbamoyltransferase complex dimerization subunit type 1 TsaB [Candidatus Blochmannia vafer]ADV33832.1 glycoprotease [Candidatus Blochmannia vafer str. BVAF]